MKLFKKKDKEPQLNVGGSNLTQKIREHHIKRPVLMVFLTSVLIVGVVAGGVAAFVALTNDRAVFRSRLTAENPVRQHILRVEGAGDLIANLRDNSGDGASLVRYNLSLLDEKGELVQRAIGSSPGQRIQIKETVTPGDYTFVVRSEDTLTSEGVSYTLRIDYPNDVAAFQDKTAPTLDILQPELGSTVSGDFVISGRASDETELAQVAVRVDDDGSWVVANGTDEWQLTINSKEYSNGQRVLNVRATDSAGNTETEQTLVNFDNGLITPEPEPEPGPTPEPEPEPEPTPSPNPGPTNPPTSGGSFLEAFNNNSGLQNLRVGVYHRNIGSQVLGLKSEVWGDSNAGHGGSWTGDHDTSCGTPDTQRQLTSSKNGGPPDGDPWSPDPNFNLDKVVYVCKDHVMTSMGDVDGYSILWFSPNKSFKSSEVKTVSWDVNVTDLKARQWWEVSVVPKGGKFLATIDWLAGTAGIDAYSRNSVIIGNGPFGNTVNITTNGTNQYNNWQGVCGTYGLDPEGCKSKAIRRRFTITDNKNGTLTVNYGGMFTQTVPGQLPSEFEVYFKDHNYTPDKDGRPAGHTWHWDNISVQ